MQNNSGFCRNHISGFATVCRKTREYYYRGNFLKEIRILLLHSFSDENGRTYRQCSTPCENRLECKYFTRIINKYLINRLYNIRHFETLF